MTYDPYWSTTVRPDRSIMGIRDLLGKFGASEFSYNEEFNGKSLTVVFKYRGLPVRFTVYPEKIAQKYLDDNPWNRKRRISEKGYIERATGMAKSVALRVLHDQLKAAFIAVEYGVVTFEDIFLSKFMAPDGTTLGDILIPRLPEVTSGKLLLPGKGR